MSSPPPSSPRIPTADHPLPTPPSSHSPNLSAAPTTPPTAPTHHPPTAAPPPPAPFSPFFTLVSSPGSPTSHHPSVHYLFSDDADTDLITSAALQTLEHSSSSSSSPSRARPSPDSPAPPDTRSPPAGSAARAGARSDAPRNRFVVIDLDASGKRVLAARSMAPDWQVVGAHVEPAPTWEGEGDGKGLLLRVEGVGGKEGGGGAAEEDWGGEGLEALVEGYMKRLGELRRVVQAGGGGEGGEGEGGGAG